MGWYKIYAGLGGSFGGATYRETTEFDNEDDANKYAYELAFEEYETYAGMYGLLDWEGAKEDYIASYGEEFDEQEIDWHYADAAEGWMEYYVQKATSEYDTDED